ncbi:hypothetical protein ONE63_003837 [Megalurothrips usitatus]|uniref:Uncharacterized protein n=1 Tax=Megalurothrips usitatus TaxID=439358 RepID=A0AAV7X7R1_9NEOP|nr:hypothetical protein ONE63_003837 [Megalurothrips usitatus]
MARPSLLPLLLAFQGLSLTVSRSDLAVADRAPGSTKNPCDEDEFWCRGGACVRSVTNCSGATQCKDLSDIRAAACHPHYTFLDVDDSDTLAIPFYDARWEAVIVMYCDVKKENCIGLEVLGETPEASVRVDCWHRCKFHSFEFRCNHTTRSQAPPGWVPYKDQQSIRYHTWRQGDVIVFRSVRDGREGRTVIIDGHDFRDELVFAVVRPKKWVSLTNAVFM